MKLLFSGIPYLIEEDSTPKIPILVKNVVYALYCLNLKCKFCNKLVLLEVAPEYFIETAPRNKSQKNQQVLF